MTEQPQWMSALSDEEVAQLAQQNPGWRQHRSQPVSFAAPVDSPVHVDDERKRKNALEGLRREAEELAAVGKGQRNHELNRVTWKMWRKYGAFGQLSKREIYDALMDASRRNGHVRDDGQMAHTTCSKALDAGEASGGAVAPAIKWREPPPPRVEVVTSIDGWCFDENDCPVRPEDIETEIAIAAAQQLADDVNKRAYQFRVTDEAQRLYSSQRAVEMGQQRPPVQLLTDMLLVPDEEATYRISRLLPTGGRALLAAQFKTGKTSLMANLVKALVDEHAFLGRFEVQPARKIVLIDTELDERMLRRWLREVGIVKTDRVSVLSLRGKLSTFDIIDDAMRAQWAAQLHGADFIILDCLRPCLDALGLDENRDAGRFLVAFDELIKECGASEAVMVHHMGHQDGGENGGKKERGRGDSRLMDWPDVIWKIVRNNDDESDDSRYFAATGRDVSLEESRLIWNPEDRSLFLHDGSRSDHSAANYTLPDIIDYLLKPENDNGVGQNVLEKAMKPLGHGRNQVRKALQGATQRGVLLATEGPRQSKLYTVNPSYEREED